jgi:Leucine-rich repeat (LRR) protein
VDVGNNSIPADKLQEIDQAVHSNRLRLICEDSNKSLSEIDLSSRYLDATDATAVAEYIKDSGALSVLSLQNNKLATKEAGKALATALAGNSTLQELDISSNNWNEYTDLSGDWMGDGPGFGQELAVGIKDNEAISKVTFGGDGQVKNEVGQWMPAVSITLEVGMTEADFSNRNLGAGAAIIVSSWIAHTDVATLAKLDIRNNRIPSAQKLELHDVCRAKDIQLSLFFTGNETELTVPGRLNAIDARLLGNELRMFSSITHREEFHRLWAAHVSSHQSECTIYATFIRENVAQPRYDYNAVRAVGKQPCEWLAAHPEAIVVERYQHVLEDLREQRIAQKEQQSSPSAAAVQHHQGQTQASVPPVWLQEAIAECRSSSTFSLDELEQQLVQKEQRWRSSNKAAVQQLWDQLAQQHGQGCRTDVDFLRVLQVYIAALHAHTPTPSSDNTVATKEHSLILCNCSLPHIPKTIFELTHITNMDLRSNNIAHLPAEIGQLHSLLYLGNCSVALLHLNPTQIFVSFCRRQHESVVDTPDSSV